MSEFPVIQVPADMFPERHLIALQVVGDSMAGDLIHDGDDVLVDIARVAADGDIAAVRVTARAGRGLVLGRLQRNKTLLVPSNPGYPALALTPAHRPVIEGVVVGVIKYDADGLKAAAP